MRIVPIVAVLTLTACSTGPAPKTPEPIPPELIPAGFTAADCRITEPGGPITDIGPDGRPYDRGTRQPKVECTHHSEVRVGESVVTTASCRASSGKDLPFSDCCMNPDGSKIPACEPKRQPPD